MSPLLWMAVFFAVGVAGDSLVTRYYMHLSAGRRLKTSVFSMGISYFDFVISLYLIVNQDWLSAGAFAAGTGLGTYLAMGKRKDK